jgi:MFS superfamily sulfate permease-like transporter
MFILEWFSDYYFYVAAGAVQTIVNGESVWLSGSPMYIMLGLVVLTIAIVILLPKVTKAVPSSLVAIIVVLIGVRIGN